MHGGETERCHVSRYETKRLKEPKSKIKKGEASVHGIEAVKLLFLLALSMTKHNSEHDGSDLAISLFLVTNLKRMRFWL